QPAATETEQRVAAKQEPMALECDVAHGMAGDRQHFEDMSGHVEAVAAGDPARSERDAWFPWRDHLEPGPAGPQRGHAADVVVMVVGEQHGVGLPAPGV